MKYKALEEMHATEGPWSLSMISFLVNPSLFSESPDFLPSSLLSNQLAPTLSTSIYCAPGSNFLSLHPDLKIVLYSNLWVLPKL